LASSETRPIRASQHHFFPLVLTGGVDDLTLWFWGPHCFSAALWWLASSTVAAIRHLQLWLPRRELLAPFHIKLVDKKTTKFIVAFIVFGGAGSPATVREAGNAAATPQRPFAGRNPKSVPGNSGNLVAAGKTPSPNLRMASAVADPRHCLAWHIAWHSG
jgi:hypothetical protein